MFTAATSGFGLQVIFRVVERRVTAGRPLFSSRSGRTGFQRIDAPPPLHVLIDRQIEPLGREERTRIRRPLAPNRTAL